MMSDKGVDVNMTKKSTGVVALSANCANCQSELAGPFCSQCGQSSRNRRGPIWRMLGEISEDIFTLDSKFHKSIYRLLFSPGYLSRQFIEGKRVAILPPIRMYLVISLLFFFVFDIPSPDVKDQNVYIGDILIGREQPIEDQITFRFVSFGEEDKVFKSWFESAFPKQIEAMKNGQPQVIVDRLFNKLEDIVPNILILFLPLFALVLKFLYLFKRTLYFDHLIFSLHFQSWLMLMILIIYALALQNPWWAALSIVLPFYLAKAQKRVYQQSYWLVIPKTIFIILVYITILAIGTAAAFFGAMTLI